MGGKDPAIAARRLDLSSQEVIELYGGHRLCADVGELNRSAGTRPVEWNKLVGEGIRRLAAQSRRRAGGLDPAGCRSSTKQIRHRHADTAFGRNLVGDRV